MSLSGHFLGTILLQIGIVFSRDRDAAIIRFGGLPAGDVLSSMFPLTLHYSLAACAK
jgi:hypothetical protein